MDNALLDEWWEQFKKAVVPVEVKEFANSKVEGNSIKPLAFQCFVAGYLLGKEKINESLLD